MKEETKNWLDQAKEHFDDMEYLYNGSRYSMAVYCAHQALEKKVRYPDFQTYTYTSKAKIKPTIDKTKEVYSWIFKQLNQP